MTLSLTLTSLEGLSAEVAAEYIEQDDGSYRLDVDGLEDTGALKRAKDHEKKKRQAAEGKVTELESQIEELQEQITGLEGSGKGKGNDAEVARLQRQVEKLTNDLAKAKNDATTEISRLHTSSAVAKIVGELTDHPDLLNPVVQARLKVVLDDDGTSKVVVLDEDGDESYMSQEDLIKEIRANKKYAPIIRASKGSGSGAPGSVQGVPGAKTKLSDYTGQERVKLQQENPAEFKRLLDLQRAGK